MRLYRCGAVRESKGTQGQTGYGSLRYPTVIGGTHDRLNRWTEANDRDSAFDHFKVPSDTLDQNDIS